jgi:uncharacterized membrane protein
MEGLESLESFFKVAGGYVALAVEMLAAVLIALGVIEAMLQLIGARKADPRAGAPRTNPLHPLMAQRWIFIRFGSWLLLALEFELAADVIRSAVAPTWADIGKLGAIAAIRTVLNFFLERDIDSFYDSIEKQEKAAEQPKPAPSATVAAARAE